MRIDVPGLGYFSGCLHLFVMVRLVASSITVKSGTIDFRHSVEPYTIPGSFLKLEYMKTEIKNTLALMLLYRLHLIVTG